MFSKFSLTIMCAGAAFLAVRPAAGQTPTNIPIAAALRDDDGDRVPDDLGRIVTVEGVLTSDPRHTSSRDAALVTLQDHTGAIYLFADTTVFYGRFRAGDTVRARGRIAHFRGQEELEILEIHTLGRGTVPAPRAVLAAELQTEQYSGQLVQLEGELRVKPEQGSNLLSAVLRDRSGEVRVYLSRSRLLNHEDFGKQIMQGGLATVTGIASQWDEEAPFDSGYRLMPRDPRDFVFHAVPPYKTITTGALILLLLAAVAHLWLRHRGAERALRERQAAAEALRQSEAKYRSLFDHAPHGIFRSTREGQFLAVNRALVTMLGYESEAEVMALDVGTQVFADPSERERLIAEWLPTGRLPGVDVRWRRKDGKTIVVRLTGRSVRSSAGALEGFETVAEDVTEQQALEQRLRQAQKMDAVGRLAGGVAHDFNNLLTVILASSDMLLDSVTDDALRLEAGQIKSAALRAAGLTRQLLAFSRRQAVAPKVLDVHAVVGSLIVMLRRVIGEDIELSTVTRSQSSRVKVDPTQLEQVVLNLAINARDAMPEGGKLVIETGEVELDEATAPSGLPVQPGTYVALSVTDTGTGMDRETLAHIFEPFFTTKELGKGTGLGLATVYGIVNQSGGYIHVESESGRGSRFTVFLPRTSEPAADEEAPAMTCRTEGSETVLLVEDEAAVRELARRVLTSRGFAVLTAPDGTAALEVASRFAGPIHALVTDVVMPRLDGRRLARSLAQTRPETKVLYMSGHNEDAVLRRGALEPGSAFLQKPFSPAALLQELGRLLDRAATAPGLDPGARN